MSSRWNSKGANFKNKVGSDVSTVSVLFSGGGGTSGVELV